MHAEFINIFLAFIEGFGLILSPCILPLLPIILSASIGGSRQRPFGIILGFVLSFAIFTYFSREFVLWFGLDLTLIRNISLILLLAFGILMISSYLTDKFTKLTQGFANIGFKLSNSNESQDFWGGIIFGALVGLIWTPCAGPIFAAVIVQSILQSSSLNGFLTILAFAIGAALPMLIIAIFGQRIMKKTTYLQQHAEIIRKILGVIIIIAVIFMYYGTGLFASTSNTTNEVKKNINGNVLLDGLSTPISAPDFSDITAWINTQPLHMKQLHGKVVLIDFWAYSCINCIRTLPYLVQWYKEYQDKGLVIVGVHSPEFDFERDLNNVQQAVKQDGIEYPVALDNNFATWKNYNNQYWPAHYLIDQNGNIVYEHFGEGDYDVTENNIRYLLGLNAKKPAASNGAIDISHQTPETYCGYERSDAYAGIEKILPDQIGNYTFPTQLITDSWALNGAWNVQAQKIVSAAENSGIQIKFAAKHVYAVLGTSTNKPIHVQVLYNGKPVSQNAGNDVKDGVIEVTGHKLYKVLDFAESVTGVLELVAVEPGLELYTFTFG